MEKAQKKSLFPHISTLLSSRCSEQIRWVSSRLTRDALLYHIISRWAGGMVRSASFWAMIVCSWWATIAQLSSVSLFHSVMNFRLVKCLRGPLFQVHRPRVWPVSTMRSRSARIQVSRSLASGLRHVTWSRRSISSFLLVNSGRSRRLAIS